MQTPRKRPAPLHHHTKPSLKQFYPTFFAYIAVLHPVAEEKMPYQSMKTKLRKTFEFDHFLDYV